MIFATLGPTGNNHELVLERYLAERGLAHAEIRLCSDFDEAFTTLLNGEVDYLLQCTAHFSHSEWVGRTMHRAFPVDAFIATSKPLGILAHREAGAENLRIGLQPATRHYADLSRYAEIIEEPTTVSVAEGLLAGRFEAGLCALEFAERYPEQLRVEQQLGPALDSWVLFGRQRLESELLLWPQAPVAELFQQG